MKKVLQSIYRAAWIRTKIQTKKNSPSVIVAANKDEIRTFLKLTMISNDFLKREIQKELILMEISDRIKYFLSKPFKILLMAAIIYILLYYKYIL